MQGTTQDFLETNFLYDKITQYTYVKGLQDAQWHLHLVTRKATITKIWERQYYFNNKTSVGKEYPETIRPNKVHKSESFDSHWDKALSVTPTYVEFISCKMGSVKFDL